MKETAFGLAVIVAAAFIIAGIWNLVQAHFEEKRWRRWHEDEESAALIRRVRYGDRDHTHG